MGEHEDPETRLTFVLRLVRDRAGGISGVVERVRTGEKARLEGLDGIAPALAAMLDRERREPP
jgi:hypothetical protein